MRRQTDGQTDSRSLAPFDTPCFCCSTQTWRTVWPPLRPLTAMMETAATWPNGLAPWKCPPLLDPAGRSGANSRAATHLRPSWRPRSEWSACWWSLLSCSFSAGCRCTVPTPGGLSMISLPNKRSLVHLSLSSTCCATPLPVSTQLFTASWTRASAKLYLQHSLAAACFVIAISAVGCRTKKRTLWRQERLYLSLATQLLAPWEAAEVIKLQKVKSRLLWRVYSTAVYQLHSWL